MYGTPFCAHEFTSEQLDSLETVACPCGNRYQSSQLREFNRLRALLAETNQNFSALVQGMASFNNGNRVVVDYVPVEAPAPRPVKPKRERPTLSVTQWLIVAAGFMVLVAASVFVSQNLEKWNVYGWSTLELSLGAIAASGAFKVKRFSILLSNFLAVFSSAMLLTLIMSYSTTFGWGFDVWNDEPGWFWSVNLATVAMVSLGLGMWSKNFGWRAIAPLSLSASAIVLVINSVGTFEDRWRIAVLSVALIAVLISVRLSRNARWAVPEGNDKEYLTDLQQREDNSLKRFGIAISILLSAYAAIALIQQLVVTGGVPFDGIATLTTAVVWLLGARINRSWVSAIVDTDQTILTLRNSASAVGLSFLGLGVLSIIDGVDFKIGLATAVGLLLLVFVLERFAKFLLLPTFAVTIAAWVTITFGLIWYLEPESNEYYRPFGFYLIATALVLSIRELWNFKQVRTWAIYPAGAIGVLSVFTFYRIKIDTDSVEIALALASTLIAINVFPVLVTWLTKRAGASATSANKWIPVVQSSVVAVMVAINFVSEGAKPYLMSVASGFLLVALLAMLLFKGKELGSRFGEQAYVAIGLSVILSGFSYGIEALKIQSGFILVEGVLILAYALIAKNIRWANVGYGVTSLSILIANSAWGTKENSSLVAVGAILLGAACNLGLVWASSKFGKGDLVTKLVTRITTGLSLVTIVSSAERFVPLDANAYWILVGTLLAIALIVELRKASNFAFIYIGAALIAASPTFYGQPEINFNARIAAVLLVLSVVLIRRSLLGKNLYWALGAQVAAGILGYFVARIGYNQFKLEWNGPEAYAFVIAILLALTAFITSGSTGKFASYLKLDVPVLVATIPSLIYGSAPNLDTPAENTTRLLVASALIWGHNVWRTLQRKQLAWLIAQALTGLLFAWCAVRALYVNTTLEWDGPELYSIAVLLTVLVGLRLASQQNLLKETIYRFGLPVAVAITPSVIYSWTSVTKQFSELDSTEITRTIAVLVIAAAAMVFGILKANRGLNLVGTVELWLIGVPGLWFKTSAIDNGSADLELRGLIIAGVIYWAIALLRKYSGLKLKSIVFIGIPVSVVLAPAIYHTLSTLGGAELRTLDWWRFSIVLTVSLVLLITGSLREIGGTFFPGLIGVIITVLPYGFHPLSNKEWFLWAILLGVAALLVWLAVRLENMRKAGREPSVWLKELK